MKVWYAGNGNLGTSTYPVNGFIYSAKSGSSDDATTLSAELAQAAPGAKVIATPFMQ